MNPGGHMFMPQRLSTGTRLGSWGTVGLGSGDGLGVDGGTDVGDGIGVGDDVGETLGGVDGVDEADGLGDGPGLPLPPALCAVAAQSHRAAITAWAKP